MRLDKEKLQIAMARAMLTRDEVAKKAKIPTGTFRNALSRGVCKPVTAGKIAKALECDVTEILED